MQSDKFVKLLDYLQVERSVLEYSMSDMRSDVRSREAHKKFDKANENEVSYWLYDASNHTTEECRFFLSKTNEERLAVVHEKRACWSCREIGHRSVDCPKKAKCIWEGCAMIHHSTLHESYIAGISFHTIEVGDSKVSDSCLLLVMSINSRIQGININVMWDTAASLSLITFYKVKQLQLKGKKMNITITKTGGSVEKIESLVYDVPLKDKDRIIGIWCALEG